ncbi:MAG: FecR domain-containing protein [Bacteroidota bacterium]
MKYTFYTSEDFLKDELFLRWVRQNDLEAKDFWEKWLRNNPDKKQELLTAKYIAQNLQPSKKNDLLEKEYVIMFETIFKEEHTHKKLVDFPQHTKFNARKVAAILLPLFIIGVAYLIFNTLSQEESLVEKNIFIEKYYPKGKKASLILEDKTEVKLNAESRIKFPTHFSDKPIREVHLDGEAFFEVAENPEKPFVIHTANLKTQVLGTSFNIDAPANEDIIEVTVVTGKVLVSDEHGDRLTLHPQELVRYNKLTGEIEKGNCLDLEKVIGWKDGKLIFNKATFSEIFKELEKWYGVQIIVEGKTEMQGIYSGRFQNESLKRVLEGIAYTSNFSFKIENNSVYIKD